MPDPGTELARRGDEMRATARLAFEELGRGAGGLNQVHRGVSDRVFRYIGPTGRPVQVVHDAVAGAVYGSLRGATGALSRGADAVLARRAIPNPHAVSTHPRGALMLGIVNGLIGDALERDGSELAEPMSIRIRGDVITPSPAGLRAAFPTASPRVVVFLHGLFETERSWCRGGLPAYGALLERDLGCSSVEIRYNSGRRISQNGRTLAELLEVMVANWPVAVEQIALVGHSMGGLVARSAGWHASQDGAGWVGRVGHVVSIGSPHLGSPVESAVHYGSALLDLLPETRPLSRFLRRRSGGVRDLRQGSLVDEDWSGRDGDALRAEACREIPLLDGALHCFVSGTITRDPKHPLGRVIGDWLVLQASASGRGRTRKLGFAEDLGIHVGGANHFTLLNHPAVYDALRRWLAEPVALRAGAAVARGAG